MKTPNLLSKNVAKTKADPIDSDNRMNPKRPYVHHSHQKRKSLSSDDSIDSGMENSAEYFFLEDWIDAQDVMHCLHISPRTLQTLRTNGTLPFSRIGNKIYYLRQDVERILRDNYTMYKIRNYGTDK